MAVDSACEKVACMALAVQTVPAEPPGGGAGGWLYVRGGPCEIVRRLP